MKVFARITALGALLAGVAVVAQGADETFKMSSLVVPHGAEQRNPTTEVAVGFGDVQHLAPWRIKRRFPRNGGVRGGQLVTLRDAMVAVSELVAMDDEMPEHTFLFSDDGMLAAVCDIPVAQEAGGISVRIEVDDGHVRNESVTGKLLDTPVRDFAKIEFIRERKKAARHEAGVPTKPAAAAKAGGQPKAGDTKTVTLPGGATMELIWCAPGTFLMGSPRSEVGRFDDEPQHKVTLTKGFWLGKYEVTQAQWKSVMGSNPSRFNGDNRPVDSVSWDDCQQFIGKVGASIGMNARLPTEAEWEYACRAGSTGAVAGTGNIGEMAWYDVNSESKTHDVGIHKANDWGFYDMHGNVLEWCADWFASPGATSGDAIDPKGPSTGSFRMLRGGCWFYFARDCRSAYRLKRDPDLRNSIFGFRMACTPK